MDILLILTLLFIAWLLGHALDWVFTKVERLIQSKQSHTAVIETIDEPRFASKTSQRARLYLVPTAVDKLRNQS
jgi:hypothetical protein